ncbi:metal-dependent hydrolase [Altererythrobacter ishigakiensis]|uniref:Inner membrane protein n=1 Tax=Altererythrobacter ishigakiensis TaxID=476157 RepID=A0A562UX39_9SPHN|nr:metal-dependent hydrolase [Altererythrobacter ishigakiensis]TWJ10192.1 inner membrane protein [Altererythrobacter ishigakiensis]
MDNLTHSLVGALLGQAGLKKKTGLAMPALVIGANLPDVDAACFFWLEGQEHLGFRRGITHGPPAMVLLPLLLAGLLWGYDRWQTKRGKRPECRLPVHFGWLYALSLLGCLTHPALDWLNVYGVRFLEPFSSQWFYGDTLFIIDVWLWALMGFATWFSLRRENKGGEWMKPARAAIAVSLAYIGLNGVISEQALGQTAQESAPYESKMIASPVPFNFWEREIILQKPLIEENELRVAFAYDVGNWSIADDTPKLQAISKGACFWPTREVWRTNDREVQAFLFWTRAPFAERAEDGSVLLRDARFYDPRARDRFTVALPDVRCEPLSREPPGG